MNHVMYFSMTGNTRKMAAAMAGVLGVEAQPIKMVAAVPADGLLFLGSGSYGDKPADEMLKFIGDNDFCGRQIALFGTSGRGEGKEVEGMAAALKQKGATIAGTYYTKGKSFVVVNIGHPTRDELAGARAFAQEMARQAGQ